MTTRLTYDQIVNTITTDAGLSALNSVYFHYFNPNGLYKVAQDLQDAMWDLYMAGKITSGAVHAYSLDFNMSEISRLSRAARVRPVDVRVWVRMIEGDIAKIRKFIAEIEAGMPVSGAKVPA